MWLARYDVGPTPLGRPRSTRSHHKLFVVLAVLELVKDRALRSAQVALQFGDTAGSCYLFLAFLEDDVLVAGKMYGQGRHAGLSVVHVKPKIRQAASLADRYLRESKREGGGEGKDTSQSKGHTLSELLRLPRKSTMSTCEISLKESTFLRHLQLQRCPGNVHLSESSLKSATGSGVGTNRSQGWA